jgi:hypothetical protein
VDRPRSGGFQDQACMRLFVFWASGTCGYCDGVPWASMFTPNAVGGQVAPVFPLRDGLLVPFESSFSATNISGRGDLTDEFPHQGRYSPATRPDTLEDDGNNGNDGDDGDVNGAKDGTSSDRCSSGSVAVWVFCLASGGLSGIIWTAFERKVFLWDAPGLPLASSWGLSASGPCVGAVGGLRFSLS